MKSKMNLIDWLKAINRGGLLCLNNMTFELFLTMEREFCFRLSSNPEFGGSDIKIHLKHSEDVLFLWAIIGAGWEEEYCSSWAWLLTCGFASEVSHKPQHG